MNHLLKISELITGVAIDTAATPSMVSHSALRAQRTACSCSAPNEYSGNLVYAESSTSRTQEHAQRTLCEAARARMVSKPAILEPFRNAVPEWEICNCREKRFRLEAEFRRQANQKAQKRSDSEQKQVTKFDRPFVWILTPTFSQKQQDNFLVRQKKQWGQGIYFLAEPDLTAVVAIHHLPKTLDTLFLRDRKSTRLNSSHRNTSRMPSSA